MAQVYSHSRLSCFENCPKQFHYRYVLKIPAETESIEAFMGKRVHEILERLHLFVRRGHVPTLPAVLNRFREDWEQKFSPERVRIVRAGDEPSFYLASGERCLRNHYRRHYPFDGEETLGIEERVTFSLDPEGSVRMRGIIDRLVRAPDGAIEIHDYKTSRRVPAQSRLDRDRQLALYQIGLNGRYAEAPQIRLVWHYLLFDQVRVSTRSAEQLERLREETRELVARIETERDFEARPSALCAWCEYNPQCPASSTRPAAESASENTAPSAPRTSAPEPTRAPSAAAPSPEATASARAGTPPAGPASRPEAERDEPAPSTQLPLL